MNNKLIGYEEAKERLRVLEEKQRYCKIASKNVSMGGGPGASNPWQMRVTQRKKEINMLLSIIHAHKQARKYYGKLKYEQKM